MNVNTDPNMPADAEMAQGAISVYGQNDGVEDFPVLKAFQQYIDAEQLKSRKRMVLLSMFFGFLMTVMIAIFVLVLWSFNQRNQALNDRLIDFAMKDRDRVAATIPAQVQIPASAAPSGNDAALKAVADTLVALQKQMSEQRPKPAAETAKEDEPYRPTAAERERTRRAEAEMKMMDEARTKLEAERKAIAAEREQRRQDEIERYRRRNYPELYAQPEQKRTTSAAPAPRTATATKPAKRDLSDQDIEDILREVDSLPTAPEKASLLSAKTKPVPKKPEKKSDDPKTAADDKDEDLKPKKHFDEDATQYDLPVKINGKSAGWHLPLQ